jgi:hypothetical protein
MASRVSGELADARLKELQNSKKEYVLLLSAMEKVLKKNRFALKELFTILIDYYKQLASEGKDIIAKGLRPSVTKLIYLRYSPTEKDISLMLPQRTTQSLILCAHKEVEIEEAGLEVEQFSQFLVGLFKSQRELRHIHEYDHFVDRSDALTERDDKNILSVLKSNAHRNLQSYEHLRAEAEEVIKKSGIKAMSAEDIVKSVEELSLVKLTLEKDKYLNSYKKALAEDNSAVDPALNMQIAVN